MLEEVEELVRKAADLADISKCSITEKGSSSNIVTSADIAVQNYLCNELHKLLPEAGFYCEEENLKDTGNQYIWVIDPIDGTMNFSRGISENCISVGLIKDRKPVLGVVFIHSRNEMFKAEIGKGAFLNGKPIHVSDRTYDKALICASASTYRKEYAKTCFQIMEEVFYETNDFRRFGSCAVELCYIACGKCELYFEFRIQPWDYAGAYAVLAEAGGVLSDLNGKELTFDQPVLLIGANSKENHKRLSDTISRYVPEKPFTD